MSLEALTTALKVRYSGWKNVEIGCCVVQECISFINDNLGDENAAQRLSSADHSQYWQQFSEVLLANRLLQAGMQVAHQRAGPDFVIVHEGQRIFIEVVTPEPKGLPLDWLNHQHGTAVSFPHDEIILRWTSVIKEKSEKLIGEHGRPGTGYLAKNIVGSDDIYVIAVNSRLLRGFGGLFPDLNGISQYPFAVEATLGLGPLQVTIDRQTLETSKPDHQYRPRLQKTNRPHVPADTFFDIRFSPISAIWAVDVDETVLVGRDCPMAVVHNPIANNQLPRGLLPAHEEFWAINEGDHYRLMREQGRLGIAEENIVHSHPERA